jgi:hypothetical protein
MNDRFEGLNLPQLLDLMHELVAFDPVSLMPQTDGWWVLLAWLLVAIALSFTKIIRHRRRNRYRREALEELERIDTASATAATQVAGIVKRTALVAYAREDVASLYGADWATFLVESAGNDAMIEKSAANIAAAPYQPGIEATDILKPAKRWVKVHRA